MILMCQHRNWKVGETCDGRPVSVMQPLMDMINHNLASQNTMRYNGDSFQLVHEGEGIAAGEEVRKGAAIIALGRFSVFETGRFW